jgi:hypothetical protein
MRKSNEQLFVEIPLTEQEYYDGLVRLRDLTGAKNNLLEKIKQKYSAYVAEKKTIKNTIRAVDEAIGDINTMLERKTQQRPVACEIVYDFQNNAKHWVRTDTQEIVKQTTIPEEDLQESAL